ncbi:molybdopterin-synthase adenylyltransferase MoeB [Paramicrobacterium agarici]|uniref:molybdopterin-synthase adenylyltransferase MoeB n=1 Tax=Paramicrobacterium agarici TaxID=630514 RepID=UPI001152A63B|nr:molybdopterin-synthase adenylyltransferase MoeB [Microbacterium agarici]TQO21616.1 adenylyltransferase/sulfurtransferase [Microbacterium agarici]
MTRLAADAAGTRVLPPLVEPYPALTRREIERYSRHLALPELGSVGQRRLRNASVLVIGAGGLGAPILHYLAAAGIGAITVIDDDVVEASNLQRQVLHREADVGRLKVDSARDALLRLDPTMTVTALNDRLAADNARELFSRHDLVLDGADNFATRYLANDAAELTGTPLIWGTIIRFAGQVSTFWPGKGPTLRDLFPDIPAADSVPNCAEGGVLGVLCGTVGSAMATEAIKLICGIGAPLIGRLLRYDALTADYSTLQFTVDPQRPSVADLQEAEKACSALPGVENTIETDAGEPDAGIDDAGTNDAGIDDVGTVDVASLAVRLDAASEIHDLLAVVDVRDDWERQLSAIPGSVHVPLERIEREGWSAVSGECDGASEMVLYCKSGVRSARARDRLAAESPDHVTVRSLAGGIDAWERGLGTR